MLNVELVKKLALFSVFMLAVGCRPPASGTWVDGTLPSSVSAETSAATTILRDENGGRIEIKSEDIKIDGKNVRLRIGAVPIAIEPSKKPAETAAVGSNTKTAGLCVSDDGCKETGCSYCTAAVKGCCGGGLIGLCLGVWGCP